MSGGMSIGAGIGVDRLVGGGVVANTIYDDILMGFVVDELFDNQFVVEA